jgi:dTDP-6-deoxy-L-talose 4-dehydrogenase (NAD+)
LSRLILLTGATGFVGVQVLKHLADPSTKVRLVSRKGGRPVPYISGLDQEVIVTPDLFSESSSWWEEVCEGVDTIIHLAWYAVPGLYLQSELNLDCVIGTIQQAKAAVKAGVRRFVGVGTCLEYELSNKILTTNTPVNPVTPYAATKAAAYFSLSSLFSKEQIEFAWCRLFYLYGKGEDERRLVPYIRARLSAGKQVALTSGTQVRDYLDVKDAGKLIANAALSNCQGPINICSGIPLSVRELAERITDEHGGRRDLLRFGAKSTDHFDPPYVVGDPTPIS